MARSTIIFVTVTIVAISNLYAQNISFQSYKKVKDPDFKTFISLFEEKQLPLLCDDIVESVNIWKLPQASISKTFVNKYLVEAGEYLTGPLYTAFPADGLPGKKVYGVLYPLYRLPTNGDYVILVVAQADDEKECEAMVVALSFDLKGKLIYFSNYTYQPGTEYYNGYIDINLVSHHQYIINKVNDVIVAPPKNGKFIALDVHTSYKINSDGKSTKLTTEKVQAQFIFSHEECRFKKVH